MFDELPADGDVEIAPNFNRLQMLVIGGQRRPGSDRRSHAIHDPATGSTLTHAATASVEDVHAAVCAAEEAFQGAWGRMVPADRGRCLQRAASLLRRHKDAFARAECLSSGKPLREAYGDVETSARYFEYYGGAADKIEGSTIPLGGDYISAVFLEPVGVTAHIIPWNFPLATTARGVAPALAAGCTAVVKPAEQTPLTAMMLAVVLERAGVPAGTYNVISGLGPEAGESLVGHAGVSHVTFTGSVATGRSVMTAAAQNVTSVTLELGGKSPVVVLADCDKATAVEGVLKAIFTNAGQVCSAGSRLIVEQGIADEIVGKVVDAAKGMSIGPGIDNAALGPLISAEQLCRVESHVAQALSRGLEVLCGGARAKVVNGGAGWYYQPTILLCPDRADPLVQEEVFGPVLVVQVARDLDHAIDLANCTSYGLVAGIYTRDIACALRFARRVDAGQIFINQYFAGGVETPFGGVKKSGFGREKGLEALRSYLRVKTMTARI